MLEVFVQDLFLDSSYTHLFVQIYTKTCFHVEMHSGMAVNFLAKEKFPFQIYTVCLISQLLNGVLSCISHGGEDYHQISFLTGITFMDRGTKTFFYFVTHEFHVSAILRLKHRHSFCASVRKCDTLRTIVLLNTLAQQFL